MMAHPRSLTSLDHIAARCALMLSTLLDGTCMSSSTVTRQILTEGLRFIIQLSKKVGLLSNTLHMRIFAGS